MEGARKDPQFQSRLRVMDIDEADLQQLFEMIDIHSEGEIDASEFIAPLSRWVHESTTAPRFIKYNMLRTIQMQEELQEATLTQFDNLGYRIDQIANVLHHFGKEYAPREPVGPAASSLKLQPTAQPRTIGKDSFPADEPAVDPEVDVPRFPTKDPRSMTQESWQMGEAASFGRQETALSPAIHVAMQELESIVLSATESALRKSLVAVESAVKDCWLEAYRPETDRSARGERTSIAMRSVSSTASAKPKYSRGISAEAMV